MKPYLATSMDARDLIPPDLMQNLQDESTLKTALESANNASECLYDDVASGRHLTVDQQRIIERHGGLGQLFHNRATILEKFNTTSCRMALEDNLRNGSTVGDGTVASTSELSPLTLLYASLLPRGGYDWKYGFCNADDLRYHTLDDELYKVLSTEIRRTAVAIKDDPVRPSDMIGGRTVPDQHASQPEAWSHCV